MVPKVPYRNSPMFGCLGNSVSVTVGTEGGNAINVAIQMKDGSEDVGESVSVFAYLSDNADGSSIAATAPTGGWAIGTDGLLIPVVANKAATLISESDGDIDVTITESGVKTFYLVLVIDGRLHVTAVAFA